MTKREAAKFIVIRSMGNFLLLFAIYGVCATFGPALYYELQLQIIEARGVKFTISPQSISATNDTSIEKSPAKVKDPPNPGFAQILAGDKQQALIPKDTDFSIVIPKIGASAKIYPNIDPNNPSQFLPILAEGIAHAKGSVFPGMEGNVYLFAHSTDNWWDVGRYNAVFYLLKDLKEGDEIVLFFENRRYEYKVAYSVIADPTSVGYLTASHAGDQRLIMQTCWPPGTTWKRLYVIATPLTSTQPYTTSEAHQYYSNLSKSPI